MAVDPRYGRQATGPGNGGHPGRRTWEDLAVAEDHEGWLSRSRVFLTPIAAPSIMGLFGVAVAVHTAWGSFWIGWGILELLVTTHVIPPLPLGAASPSFAFWFIALTLVTFFGAVGALAQGLGVFITLAVLTAGSAVTAAGLYAGSLATMQAGGVLFVISAAAAWLTAGSMVLEHAFGRTIIPLGKWSKASISGVRATDPISYPAGMPGVRVGQ